MHWRQQFVKKVFERSDGIISARNIAADDTWDHSSTMNIFHIDSEDHFSCHDLVLVFSNASAQIRIIVLCNTDGLPVGVWVQE